MTEMQDTAAELRDRPVVLFDFDGTLANTVPAILRVFRETFASFGMEPPESQLRQLIGPPLVVGFHEVMGLSEEDTGRALEVYSAIFDETVEPEEFPPIEGMPGLVRDLRDSGRRLGVATARRQESVESMLEALGYADCLDAVVGIEEEAAPDRMTKADCILEALDRLEARPSEAVMVGDLSGDVRGAREAGMPCIGFYTGMASEGELEEAGAAAVARSASELRALLLGAAVG